MALIPSREYLFLIVGDILLFAVSLYLALWLRYFELPAQWVYVQHLLPFSALFLIWILVFFIAGLYGKHTRLFKRRLPSVIFWSQVINMVIAAIFFFIVPVGIAPKTVLLINLAVSFPLIFVWRLTIFPHLPLGMRMKAVLMATGDDADALMDEVEKDPRFSFYFVSKIDTAITPKHELIQCALRFAEENVSLIVVDLHDEAVKPVLPILYDAAFQKERVALADIVDVYQEVFDRVPLSHVQYQWILERASASRTYGAVKRAIDITGAGIVGLLTLPLMPFIILAIKMDDAGPIFIQQERVGRRQQPIQIIKFRTMSGNDHGNYDENGKTKLVVTRVGAFLRKLRLDELPQILAVIKGDLSLVGPRPELPALAAQYSARIPYYNARYLVAPGLTGWAQIRHDRDPHHGLGLEETKEKLSYDLYYMSHRSFWLDVFILFQTVRIVFTAKGS